LSQAAKETADIIEKSIQKINLREGLALKTAESFDEIRNSIKTVSKILIKIAKVALEQVKGINQVEEGIHQVDQVTQQNAASAEENASATNELRNQTSEMRRVVNKFLTRNDNGLSLEKYIGNDPENPKGFAKTARGKEFVFASQSEQRQITAETPPQNRGKLVNPEDVILF
jgi:methyl-accepting chemotaxis protein